MRWLNAVATVGGERMRPSFGFVLLRSPPRGPTVSRLAELLGVAEQATTRLVDDMVTPGFLQRSERRGDRGQNRLHPSPAGKRIRERALAESREMEDELRRRFGDAHGDAQVDALRTLLIDFVERHRGGDELGTAVAVLRSVLMVLLAPRAGWATAGQIERQTTSITAQPHPGISTEE